KTVSTYKTRLLLKLNAHSLVDLIDWQLDLPAEQL
ncbi:hypothetical protein PSYJA_46918, partial [Pseudomonas syringae pv. japonica str. M301072]